MFGVVHLHPVETRQHTVPIEVKPVKIWVSFRLELSTQLAVVFAINFCNGRARFA